MPGHFGLLTGLSGPGGFAHLSSCCWAFFLPAEFVCGCLSVKDNLYVLGVVYS